MYSHNDTGYHYINNSYNDKTNNRAGHAVMVVGWDDNYSKDNFRDGVKPEKMVHGLFVIVGETEPVHIIIRVIFGCHMKRFLYPIRLGCLIFLLMMDMITIIRLMED